jgi:carbohydrate-selective porin OprB
VITLPEDTEFSLEVYYRYMAEDGKLQITPHLIFVSEPGGGQLVFGDDALFILGLRIHVPF